MKTYRLRNVTPFILDGWPIDSLDQETMVELGKISDRTGWTVAKIMREMTDEYMAKCQAEAELPAKLIQFPISQKAARSAPPPPAVARAPSDFQGLGICKTRSNCAERSPAAHPTP